MFVGKMETSSRAGVEHKRALRGLVLVVQLAQLTLACGGSPRDGAPGEARGSESAR